MSRYPQFQTPFRQKKFQFFQKMSKMSKMPIFKKRERQTPGKFLKTQKSEKLKNRGFRPLSSFFRNSSKFYQKYRHNWVIFLKFCRIFRNFDPFFRFRIAPQDMIVIKIHFNFAQSCRAECDSLQGTLARNAISEVVEEVSSMQLAEFLAALPAGVGSPGALPAPFCNIASQTGIGIARWRS